MFTGIIESLGTVESIDAKGEDFRLRVNCAELDMADVKLGDSIAVNGVCLTAVDFSDNHFSADVSAETLRHSALGQLQTGSIVNLEKALMPTSRLGGHLVSGHVDGLGKVIKTYDDGNAIRFVIEAPEKLSKYIAARGSICVDGISLTVNDVEGDQFYLNIVPHTAEKTTAKNWRAGVEVNLEVDVIARYIERLLSGEISKHSESNITEGFLAEHGFLKNSL
jgi:riboflavin synthase